MTWRSAGGPAEARGVGVRADRRVTGRPAADVDPQLISFDVVPITSRLVYFPFPEFASVDFAPGVSFDSR